jgi:TonB family protein
MKHLLVLFVLMPVFCLSQKIKINEYDRYTKKRRIELEPMRIVSNDKSTAYLSFIAHGSVLYAQISGYGWGASAVDQNQEMIMLFSNDSTVKLRSTDVQTTEVNASFQNTYKHNYFATVHDLQFLRDYEVVGIRKYGLGDFYDIKVSKEGAARIKQLSTVFLNQLKIGKIFQTVEDINVSDIAKHVGDSVRFCSKVYNSRYYESSPNKPTVLDVNDNYSNQFLNIVIWQQDRRNFSNAPESLYNKKDICVSGVVELINNKHQIVVRNRNQIVVKTPISLAEVDKFVGDSVTVHGKVRTAKSTGTTATPGVVTMGDSQNQSLGLVMNNKDLAKLGSSPETYYQNKDISVTGKIEMYNGKPQIVVQNANQITERPDQAGKILNQPEKNSNAEPVASANAKKAGERTARFPGGNEAMLRYLKTNLVYPEDGLEPGETRLVVAKFLISTDGTASDVQIIQSAGNGFDEEVVRVLKKMPKWEPQLKNGAPVAARVTQHVSFSREGDSAKKRQR